MNKQTKFFGFQVEEHIAITLKIIFILIFAILLSRVVQMLMNRFIKRSSADLKIDPTRYKFAKNSLNVIIVIFAAIAIIHSIPSLRTISLTLLTGAGIFAAVLGLASQQAFSNIFSGIFVVIFRPFRVGDVIRVGQDLFGVVEDITLRHTIIRDFENRRIIIPNAVINNETIINNDIVDERVRRNINVSISYESDIDKAILIIQQLARSHKYFLDSRTDEEKQNNTPDVVVRVIELGDFAVKLRAYVWARNFDEAFEMHCDLNKLIKEEFNRQGIEIPYPHRTIVYKKDIIK
jgi:small-conductance mechanosensitive channel